MDEYATALVMRGGDSWPEFRPEADKLCEQLQGLVHVPPGVRVWVSAGSILASAGWHPVLLARVRFRDCLVECPFDLDQESREIAGYIAAMIQRSQREGGQIVNGKS
jgi:hypothetical protein